MAFFGKSYLSHVKVFPQQLCRIKSVLCPYKVTVSSLDKDMLLCSEKAHFVERVVICRDALVSFGLIGIAS